jgi:hypothetical protein
MGRWIIVISESVTAMKPSRALMGAEQWLFSSRIDWDVGSTEFNCIQRVPGGLLNSDVSGDGRDRDNTDFREPESHDESDRIIGGCIGIDQKGAGHAVG